ncbi:Regulator of Vps4 activity in the MVB pathway protein [Euphorbia peplus]|nr:Regulator of Vps4 activity in the MVB pathway protein [Euphorbia peplus]
MGKIDCFIGRGLKATKLKPLLNLATSRLSVFKNQRLNRSNLARSDVLQLLHLGHHERALLRVENVIKEQNMLDVYVMIEGYCNLLLERLHLIEEDRICPDELKEAMSGLLYASSRCGDFPELQEIRSVLTAHYGREFAARAIELRNHCGVCPKLIQKLSTRHPDIDTRMRLLKEIASENNIVLQLEEASSKTEEKFHIDTTSGPKLSDEMGKDVHDLKKTKKRYKDVADAAQAAFESAAHAAEAARAAVELSRSEPHDPHNQDGPYNQGRKPSEIHKSMNLESDSDPENLEIENLKVNNVVEEKSSTSSTTSNSDLIEDDLRVNSMSLDSDQLAKQLEKDVVLYDSDGGGDIQEATEAPESQGSVNPNREHGRISVRTKGVRRY